MQYKFPVTVWLIVGLVLVFFQIVIGGITRLTDSGLSITEWNVIKGVLPPLNEEAWAIAFDSYQRIAFKQFESIHATMTLSEFKFIYFWEWFHRLWARSIGIIFIIPFIFFVIKGWLSSYLYKMLAIVVGLGALAAIFGWIMVSSGLNTPHFAWVNAYKLSIHLGIAFILFAVLFWTVLHTQFNEIDSLDNKSYFKNINSFLLFILFFQIILGGWMSGMKAGLFYNDFPTIGGEYIPKSLLDLSNWTYTNFKYYASNSFAVQVIQFLHRSFAYIVLVATLYFSLKWIKSSNSLFRLSSILLIVGVIIQVILGIITLISCQGKIPVLLGVLHQAFALVLLSLFVFNRYIIIKSE